MPTVDESRLAKQFKPNHSRFPIEYKTTENGCWVCTSHKGMEKGYPSIKRLSKKWRLNRYMYYLVNGDIPKNMVVRHKCDNSLCINPGHLELGTQQDNVRDTVQRDRTFKPKGSINPRAKVTKQKYNVIVSMLESGIKKKDIVTKTKLSHDIITGISKGTHWACKEYE
jgi:hypothetical protein